MNVLIVVSHLRRGGLVEVVYNLCRRLHENVEDHIIVLSLRSEPVSSMMDEFRKVGIETIGLNCSYLLCEVAPWLVAKRVHKIVVSRKIDIVHCHGYHPALVCARLSRVHTMTTLHDRATEDFVNAYGCFVGNYMLTRYFKALRRFDKNVAVSESGAVLYSGYLNNIDYVNNGIDTDKFCVISDDDREARRKHLHLPTDGTLFVTSGRVEREKRCEEMVAFLSRKCNDKRVYLIVLGDGSRLESCKSIAKDCPNIIFTGRITNVADYLQCADYYISYSKSEGMSMAVCEAIACGLYPVLSNIPSHVDVGKPVGGILFDDIEDVNIDNVISVSVDKKVLHNYIEMNFSTTSMMNRYVNVYKELCAK